MTSPPEVALLPPRAAPIRASAASTSWTAEPTLEKRHQTGWWFIAFMLFATVLGYLAYRNVWAGMKH